MEFKELWRRGFEFEYFTSRKSQFDMIVSALKNENHGVIVVWGMGGIGKTKMVVEIGKKLEDEKFARVVMSTVSQTPDIKHIQGTLADMLGLKFESSDVVNRARKLHAEILQARTLIILDDVWKMVNLNDIGIPLPSDYSGVKILLTSRNTEVCRDMCGFPVEIKTLHNDEALHLFRLVAKPSGLDKQVKKIVKECSGLPLALCTVGESLKGKDEESYIDAILRLSQFNFVDIDDVDQKEIYPCLKLSYDYLKDEDAKKCFLLCCLYPEDSEIYVESFTRQAFGLRLFENVNSVGEARRKIFSIFAVLEGAGLISPIGKDKVGKFVKMHDLVRDVARWIARNDESYCDISNKGDWKKVYGLYVKDIETISCKDLRDLGPNSQILVAKCSSFPDNLLEKTRDLKVLDLSSIAVDFQLSSTLQNLTNIRTLRLILRNSISNLSVVGKLKNLEILVLESFLENKSNVLPEEVGELSNLRVLDLSTWGFLHNIPPTVLVRLVKLEELHCITHCVYDLSEKKASNLRGNLSGLLSLDRLEVLTAWVGKVVDFPRNFRFPKLEQYCIFSSGTGVKIINSILPYYTGRDVREDGTDFHPYSCLGLCNSRERSVDGFEELLPDVKKFYLINMEGLQNMIPQVKNVGFQSLKELHLQELHLQSLIDTKDKDMPHTLTPPLHLLERLFMMNLDNFVEMYRGPTPINFLANLKHITIIKCPKLENIVPGIFPVGFGRVLETLQVMSCENLQNVFNLDMLETIWPEPQNNLKKSEVEARLRNLISLSKISISECHTLKEIFLESHMEKPLVVLELRHLDELKGIWKSPQQHLFLHNLETIKLIKCKKLGSLFASTSFQSLINLRCLEIIHCESLETIIVPDQQDEASRGSLYSTLGKSLQEIRVIKIRSCYKLKSVLPISLSATSFSKLEQLCISNCYDLEQVLWFCEEETTTQIAEIEMKNLKELELVNLPKLIRLFPSNYHLTLPVLSNLHVDNKFTSFIKKPINLLENQEEIQATEGCKLYKKGGYRCSIDLNGVLGKHHPPVSFSIGSQESIDLTACCKNLVIELALPFNLSQYASFIRLHKIEISDHSESGSLFTLSLVKALPELRSVVIDSCHNLEHILGGEDSSKVPESACFPKLEDIHIRKCYSLRDIWPISVAHGLPCLKSLNIEDCSSLKHVFYDYRKDNELEMYSLPKLQNLHLKKLPKLVKVIPDGCSVNFPCLRKSGYFPF